MAYSDEYRVNLARNGGGWLMAPQQVTDMIGCRRLVCDIMTKPTREVTRRVTDISQQYQFVNYKITKLHM